jgi:mono/diheme cytochrome c family protein
VRSLAEFKKTWSGVLVVGWLALGMVPVHASGQSSDASALGAPVAPLDPAAAHAEVKKTYDQHIAPFIKNYCVDCHGAKKSKGGVSFHYPSKTPGAPAFRRVWKQAAEVVKNHDMPPEDAPKQPTPEEAERFSAWVSRMKFLSPKDPGPAVIRRLTRTEYGNTLRVLFGVEPDIARELPDEVFGEGYLNSVSPLLMEQFLGIATQVVQKAFPSNKPSPVQDRWFGPKPVEGADLRVSAEGVAQRLARGAFRRPPSDAELKVLLAVFDLGRKNGMSYEDALRQMVRAVLVSPQFLFITPTLEAAPDQVIVPLDPHHLASRLSYFLWAEPPDEALSAEADTGALLEPGRLEAQTRRLLADPRSRALFDGFGAQWLGVGRLAEKTFDAQKFPEMTMEVRRAMYEEARMLFDCFIRENLSIVRFIDCDFSFLNETLAPFYGLQGKIQGTEMRRVSLSDPNRGGILTLPGTLAMTSFPNRTSPVNRGVWVLEQVLGQHVPPPPPNVPSLEKQNPAKVANLTLRQRTELHRTNAVCASCHRVLDPIGFGLENFDAIGRWRDRDESGGAVDPVGELPEAGRFETPRELKTLLARRADDLCRNLANRLLGYALCRPAEGYDEIVSDEIAAETAKDGYRLQTLVVRVVTSYSFLNRRVPETLP